jgi:hypothetical protein
MTKTSLTFSSSKLEQEKSFSWSIYIVLIGALFKVKIVHALFRWKSCSLGQKSPCHEVDKSTLTCSHSLLPHPQAALHYLSVVGAKGCPLPCLPSASKRTSSSAVLLPLQRVLPPSMPPHRSCDNLPPPLPPGRCPHSGGTPRSLLRPHRRSQSPESLRRASIAQALYAFD